MHIFTNNIFKKSCQLLRCHYIEIMALQVWDVDHSQVSAKPGINQCIRTASDGRKDH